MKQMGKNGKNVACGEIESDEREIVNQTSNKNKEGRSFLHYQNHSTSSPDVFDLC